MVVEDVVVAGAAEVVVEVDVVPCGSEVSGSSAGTEEAVEVVEAEVVLGMAALVVVVVDTTVTAGSEVFSVPGVAGSEDVAATEAGTADAAIA